MAANSDAYQNIRKELAVTNTALIAVSKTKPVEDILELYHLGQRDFGENYVQELAEKAAVLPNDIRWHFIGHLQSNKVKYIAPFVHLIHGVDSFKLLQEINKQAAKQSRLIECLLQVYIAKEETKFGLDAEELASLLKELSSANLNYVKICGLMGMASFSDKLDIVRNEFKYLKGLFDKFDQPQTGNYNFQTLSMGMSSDYKIAIEEGSTMVRIGSLIFGER
ncbi:MAG: YggS family pyridoxal phosphate-dependent enzyme [Chitinophagaceae bacterium]|nr:YggS family pyridoxal phosphate-dependent enzyme [Chitinophagaceae bacterium]MBK8953303.1 YggS family pyridoxal phosphate-dependent enzyme [Chitinophagaceae bacterium]